MATTLTFKIYYLARALFERFKLVDAIAEAADFAVSLFELVGTADPRVGEVAIDTAEFAAEPIRYTPFLKAITKTVILSTEPR